MKTKLSYDIALLPEGHPDADLDNLCSEAYEAMLNIEAELASRKLLTPDETYEVLRIALENLSDEASTIVEENDIGLLRAVRLGLAWMLPPANKPQGGDAARERGPDHDNEGTERIPGGGRSDGRPQADHRRMDASVLILIAASALAASNTGGFGGGTAGFSCDVNTRECKCDGVWTGADCKAMAKNCDGKGHGCFTSPPRSCECTVKIVVPRGGRPTGPVKIPLQPGSSIKAP